MLETPNLLVTDDDSAFRRVVCEGLVRRGFHVTEARDGREALDLLYETPESPPCVLMSAALNDEIRREAERMRVFDILSKPVRLQKLTDIVCEALTSVYGWQPRRR
jgi:DNA-binding NarL/FixJ family response regulator